MFVQKGDAHVNITAADKTAGGFNSAQKNLKSFGKTAGSVLGGFGVGIGVSSFAAMARSAVDYGSSLTDVADKLGVGTEALQEWNYAAKQNGVAQSAAEMGLQRFVRRVAEAAQGTGELKGTLDQYGIAVRNADGSTRDVWAVMGDLSNAIKNAESDGERLRIAFKAFDSEGAALVSILKNGSAALDEFRESAHKAGQVMTEETARRLDSASDSIDRFLTRMTILTGESLSFWEHIFSGENPYVAAAEEASDAFRNKLQPAVLEIIEQQELLDEAIREGWSTLSIDHLKEKIEGLKEVYRETAKAAHDVNSGPPVLGSDSAQVKRLDALIRQYTELNSTPEQNMDVLRSEVELLQDSLKELTDQGMRGTEEWVKAYTEAMQKAIRLHGMEKTASDKAARDQQSSLRALGLDGGRASSTGENPAAAPDRNSWQQSQLDRENRLIANGTSFSKYHQFIDPANAAKAASGPSPAAMAAESIKASAKEGTTALDEIATGIGELVQGLEIVKQQVANAR